MTKSIRCKKCKKIIFYIPEEYDMNVKVLCTNCHDKIPAVRTSSKETLVQKFSRIKKGIREDVHPTYSFRSPTEANFARILNLLGCEWTYEERVFTFEGYNLKPHLYVMDFVITKGCERFRHKFYEIKGYMTSSSKQKLRRLKKQYPEEFKETSVVIYSKYNKKDIEFCNKLGYNYMFYDELSKEFKGQIPLWEGK